MNASFSTITPCGVETWFDVVFVIIHAVVAVAIELFRFRCIIDKRVIIIRNPIIVFRRICSLCWVRYSLWSSFVSSSLVTLSFVSFSSFTPKDDDSRKRLKVWIAFLRSCDILTFLPRLDVVITMNKMPRKSNIVFAKSIYSILV